MRMDANQISFTHQSHEGPKYHVDAWNGVSANFAHKPCYCMQYIIRMDVTSAIHKIGTTVEPSGIKTQLQMFNYSNASQGMFAFKNVHWKYVRTEMLISTTCYLRNTAMIPFYRTNIFMGSFWRLQPFLCYKSNILSKVSTNSISGLNMIFGHDMFHKCDVVENVYENSKKPLDS